MIWAQRVGQMEGPLGTDHLVSLSPSTLPLQFGPHLVGTLLSAFPFASLEIRSKTATSTIAPNGHHCTMGPHQQKTPEMTPHPTISPLEETRLSLFADKMVYSNRVASLEAKE